ncbi:MAG: glycosyltransferase family 4 protein [Deltaproteobacteria bacterium]|jgi:glycosyltransferase involved in cell wall biosynthesis|nr:glycosyltransferase family 4 protein [Deltaproteobacteria bacterium]
MTIKVANIIEDGRLGGPQVRISEVVPLLNSDINTNNYDIEETSRRGDTSGSEEESESIETVVVFPFEEGELFRERLEKYDILYKQLPLHRLSKMKKYMIRYVLFFPFEIWILYRFLKKHQFDIVHVSGGSWQYKGAIAGRLAGCKVLWELNDTKMPSIVHFCFRFLAAKVAHGFIVVAQRAKKYYLKSLQKKNIKPIFEIQSPVNCTFFNPDVVDLDSKISSYDGLHIVTVANVNPIKGIEVFLQMAVKLNKIYSDLNFWIVGPLYDSQKAYYDKLIKLQHKTELKNCFFYGYCSDVRKVLKSADIYVCSSIAEASPLSVWEAMAMEKPIISTDVGDISRFIKHGYNGYIAQVKNVGLLVDNVSKIIDNIKESKNFGQRSREIALKNFDTPIIAQKHVHAYTSVYNLNGQN